MKQPTKTQTGPLYPNLWAEAQYNAKPWAMANKINATEEVVVKIIWGKEPLHIDEAKGACRIPGAAPGLPAFPHPHQDRPQRPPAAGRNAESRGGNGEDFGSPGA